MTRMDEPIGFQLDDGGRLDAGFRGKSQDCVVRAIAIATGIPYAEVYATVNELGQTERRSKGRRNRSKSSASSGVHTDSAWFRRWMASIGWRWTPTMFIGSGCRVHLTRYELPMGRLIVSLSGHYAAVIDHVVHDLYCDHRGGTRCVYGYWSRAGDALRDQGTKGILEP